MGASLQTLDEEKIDHGTVLSQTPSPGMRIIQHPTLSRVNRKLAMEGADLLVQGLRDGVHIPPYVDAGWKAKELEGQPLQHAPKITKADTQIDWLAWTAEDWRRRVQISQAVWTMVATSVKGEVWVRRLIFHDVMEVPAEEVSSFRATIEVVTRREGEGEQRLRKLIALDRRGFVYILLDKHTWVRVRRATLEGKAERPAASAIRDFVVLYKDSDKPPTKGKINEWKGEGPSDSQFEGRGD
jgi:methionyl-tRNA formyltransferase